MGKINKNIKQESIYKDQLMELGIDIDRTLYYAGFGPDGIFHKKPFPAYYKEYYAEEIRWEPGIFVIKTYMEDIDPDCDEIKKILNAYEEMEKNGIYTVPLNEDLDGDEHYTCVISFSQKNLEMWLMGAIDVMRYIHNISRVELD